MAAKKRIATQGMRTTPPPADLQNLGLCIAAVSLTRIEVQDEAGITRIGVPVAHGGNEDPLRDERQSFGIQIRAIGTLHQGIMNLAIDANQPAEDHVPISSAASC